MYTLHIPDAVFSSTTVAGLFAIFNDVQVRSTETSHIRLAGAAAGERITRYNGRLVLRMPGTARSIVTETLLEIRNSAAFRCSDGSLRAPWEIPVSDWNVLFDFVETCRKPEALLCTDQIDVAVQEARARGARFSLSDLCLETLERLFGFGYCGPQLAGTEERHSRHGLHVAYALLANLPVPEDVLQDYRSDPQAFRYAEWGDVLMRVPALRGAIARGKLRTIESAMRHNGKTIDAANADAIVALAAHLEIDPAYPAAEDTLHAAGLIDDLSLPDCFQQSVDVGQPVSPLAARVRERVAQAVRKRSIDHADSELAAGRISRRTHRHRCDIARLEEGRHTFEHGNRLARALTGRDVQALLDVLDTPDERNRASKAAFQEVLGVKLTGLRGVARRSAVFALCGYDATQQAQWERQAAQGKIESDAGRELADARAAAARARYIGPQASEISGAEHVDLAIREGYSKIEGFRRGAAMTYALVRGSERTARRLSAKDGTLAYARAILASLAA
ncbi:conserved hypothetical protein [Paraburkholderia unamae]|uniref:hypothetical protein n=1 Tax=Paraburkholderia unamae TaxID=219649 RepID=UPI001CB2A237|nr:hypothetical protein [Paraburkholderia unamae]CAG9255023.1 conserved hypothetical protein [Paraburkholderia unamae]